MSLASTGYRQVENIVSEWTQKYQYHISLQESKQNIVKFIVQFSLTKPQKPIPIGTIKVYFTCCKKDDILETTFRFQKDSLIHFAHKTIRNKKIQKWLDDVLAKKLLVRETVFYLGTSYEQTRVRDKRQDKILEEIIQPKIEQYCYLDSQLLQDQSRFIEIMQTFDLNEQQLNRFIKQNFIKIDIDNIGVITYIEFIKLMQNIGIKITQKEQKQLLQRVDNDRTGMVEYKDYYQIAIEIFQSRKAKQQANQLLEERKNQEVFGSILSFINDSSYSIEEEILELFRQRDQDETGKTTITEVKTVLQKINSNYQEKMKKYIEQEKQKINKKIAKKKNTKENQKQQKQQKKLKKNKTSKQNKKLQRYLQAQQSEQINDLLGPVELAQLMKILNSNYGYKDIPYALIHGHIIKLKINMFTKGRVLSRMSKLEEYIREIMDLEDQKKFGRLKMSVFLQVFKKNQKIKLTKAQLYILANVVPKQENQDVCYEQHSKFIAELIKKMYINSSKRKLIQLHKKEEEEEEEHEQNIELKDIEQDESQKISKQIKEDIKQQNNKENTIKQQNIN